jgi:hypothetical protein
VKIEDSDMRCNRKASSGNATALHAVPLVYNFRRKS